MNSKITDILTALGAVGVPSGAGEKVVQNAQAMDDEAKKKGVLTKTNEGSGEGSGTDVTAFTAELISTDYAPILKTLAEVVGQQGELLESLSGKLDLVLQKTERSDAAIAKLSEGFGGLPATAGGTLSDEQTIEIQRTQEAVNAAKQGGVELKRSPSGAIIRPREKVSA